MIRYIRIFYNFAVDFVSQNGKLFEIKKQKSFPKRKTLTIMLTTKITITINIKIDIT